MNKKAGFMMIMLPLAIAVFMLFFIGGITVGNTTWTAQAGDCTPPFCGTATPPPCLPDCPPPPPPPTFTPTPTATPTSIPGTYSWKNPSGGDYGVASNWDANLVPGSGDNIIFDIAGDYNVTVGARGAGSIHISNGSVGFFTPTFNVFGNMRISRSSKLTLPEGYMSTVGIVLGALPPASLPSSDVSRLHVFNDGTLLNSPMLTVGQAWNGELFIANGARVESFTAYLGNPNEGNVFVGGQGSLWNVSDSLMVAAQGTGSLMIEAGGRVNAGYVIMGNPAEQPGKLTVDGAAPDGNPSQLMVANNLDLGKNSDLTVSNGGHVEARNIYLEGGDVKDTDSKKITVTGVHPSGIRSSITGVEHIIVGRNPSILYSLNSLDILYGGLIHTKILTVGESASHDWNLVRIGGISTGGEVASLIVQDPSINNGLCRIGGMGSAEVWMFDGARMECEVMGIGGINGSSSYVIVGNSGELRPPTLTTDSLQIGGDFFYTFSGPGTGTLEIQGGSVNSSGMWIGSHGILSGNGVVMVGVEGLFVDGGTIEPGVSVIAPPANPLRPSPLTPLAPAIQPGMLTITGTLTLSPTAVIRLDVNGPNPGQYDQLVVNGDVSLDGKLVLTFGEGFTPRKGDTFNFIQVNGNASGAPNIVEIQGLMPGFEYQAQQDGSTLVLTALNDGVAIVGRAFIPFLTR